MTEPLHFYVKVTNQRVQRDLQKLRLRDQPKATRDAINGAGKKAWRRTAKRVAKRLKVAQKVLTKPTSKRRGPRIQWHKASLRNQTGRVWVGASPLSAMSLGKRKETGGGVKAGKHRFPGAFLATVRETGQDDVVLRRTGRFKTKKSLSDRILFRKGKRRETVDVPRVKLSPWAQALGERTVRVVVRREMPKEFARQLKRYARQFR